MIPYKSKISDSCPAEPDPQRDSGGGAACGSIPAANVVGTSRCEGSDPDNSGCRDGRLNAPVVAGRGRRPAAKHGEGTGTGIAAEAGTASAVEGHEQKGAASCRNEEAAKGSDTPRTKSHRKPAPGGRIAVRSIGEGFPVDSPDPAHSATSFPRNEETPTGLSGRFTAAGAGDPPHGRPGVAKASHFALRCHGQMLGAGHDFRRPRWLRCSPTLVGRSR